jgi:hypothetical protein
MTQSPRAYGNRLLAKLSGANRAPAIGLREVYRHKKRGSCYMVLSTATLQTDTPLTDMTELVVYVAEDGRTWVRPQAEFFDGRFERVEGV